MGIYPGVQKIVRTWADHDAPTGEGSRYQTGDGRVWKPEFHPSDKTGESLGAQKGNQITITKE